MAWYGAGLGLVWKARCSRYKQFCVQAAVIGVVFAALMLLLRSEMMMNITLTVVFVFVMFAMIYWYGRKMEETHGSI